MTKIGIRQFGTRCLKRIARWLAPMALAAIAYWLVLALSIERAHQAGIAGNVEHRGGNDHGFDSGTERKGNAHREDESWKSLQDVHDAHGDLVGQAADVSRDRAINRCR